MSGPAAIRGTFADFRLIKSRKVAQLVVELPIEEADAALATLGGLPQPAAERWVALARLNGEPKKGVTYGEFAQVVQNAYYKTHPEEKEKRRFEELKSSMQAGIRCSEQAFWRFLNEEFGREIFDEQEAANFVRHRCSIGSRSALNLDPVAAAKWRELNARYILWLQEPQHA